jgi:hypothetical protein
MEKKTKLVHALRSLPMLYFLSSSATGVKHYVCTVSPKVVDIEVRSITDGSLPKLGRRVHELCIGILFVHAKGIESGDGSTPSSLADGQHRTWALP